MKEENMLEIFENVVRALSECQISFLESDTNISKHLTELSLNFFCLHSKLISTRSFFDILQLADKVGTAKSKLFEIILKKKLTEFMETGTIYEIINHQDHLPQILSIYSKLICRNLEEYQTFFETVARDFKRVSLQNKINFIDFLIKNQHE